MRNGDACCCCLIWQAMGHEHGAPHRESHTWRETLKAQIRLREICRFIFWIQQVLVHDRSPIVNVQTWSKLKFFISCITKIQLSCSTIIRAGVNNISGKRLLYPDRCPLQVWREIMKNDKGHGQAWVPSHPRKTCMCNLCGTALSMWRPVSLLLPCAGTWNTSQKHTHVPGWARTTILSVNSRTR